MNFYYLVIIVIISSSLSVFCQKQDQREYRELITEPVKFVPHYNRIIDHAELPSIKDELSITLKINIASHGPGWYTVFYKGKKEISRTPSLWLAPNISIPCPRFSITNNFDIGFDLNGYELLLNRWYHIAYTLSNREKRINFYIDGEWVGSFSLTLVQSQSIIFNDEPLYIGSHLVWEGITGQISNFRYYNFRLSPEEVLMDYSGENPIKSNVGECSCTGSIIGSFFLFFLAMILLAGGLFLYKRIEWRQYQAID